MCEGICKCPDHIEGALPMDARILALAPKYYAVQMLANAQEIETLSTENVYTYAIDEILRAAELAGSFSWTL